jgi:hypothetical protein
MIILFCLTTLSCETHSLYSLKTDNVASYKLKIEGRSICILSCMQHTVRRSQDSNEVAVG